MSWIITYNIIGEKFDPSKIGVEWHRHNRSEDICQKGPFNGKPYGYGSATYLIPKSVTRLNKFKHLADLFEPLLDVLKKHGAENWWIEIGRLYSAQCNEEVGFEELEQIVRLKCSFSYSAYRVTEEEENEGFDIENYG